MSARRQYDGKQSDAASRCGAPSRSTMRQRSSWTSRPAASRGCRSSGTASMPVALTTSSRTSTDAAATAGRVEGGEHLVVALGQEHLLAHQVPVAIVVDDEPVGGVEVAGGHREPRRAGLERELVEPGGRGHRAGLVTDTGCTGVCSSRSISPAAPREVLSPAGHVDAQRVEVDAALPDARRRADALDPLAGDELEVVAQRTGREGEDGPVDRPAGPPMRGQPPRHPERRRAGAGPRPAGHHAAAPMIAMVGGGAGAAHDGAPPGAPAAGRCSSGRRQRASPIACSSRSSTRSSAITGISMWPPWLSPPPGVAALWSCTATSPRGRRTGLSRTSTCWRRWRGMVCCRRSSSP